MAQISNLGLDEDEVELSLGLSLGGGFRKRPTTSSTSSTVDLKGSDVRDEADPNSLDPQKKRELHALRRQEARKKREQKKNGQWNGNGVLVNRSDSVADKMLLETQRFEARVRDRTVKENEGSRSERRAGGDQNVGLSLTPNPNPNPNPNFGGYHPNGFTVLPPSPPPPTAAMQYPFHPMPYVPFGNGFHYPYMVPYWGPAAATVPLQPSDSVARADGPRPDGGRAFRPFQPSDRDPSGGERVAGSDSGQNGSKGGGPSSGSTASSSSAVSDNQSEFLRGGSSSDTRSHSSRRLIDSQPQVSLPRNPQRQSEQCTSTHQMELAQHAEDAIDKPVPITTTTQSGSSKLEEPATTTYTPISNMARSGAVEPISATKSPPKSPLPPIPTAGHDCDDSKNPGPSLPSLPHMPCVSTTGNGPNGKTITGFLYRYTKTEVSIVCVCHGSSFSPAEFVKHAGGTDILHPLKHIVVVPSTFG